MDMTFTRTKERACRITPVRDDGVTVSVPTNGRKVGVPHEFCHYVVESEFRLEHGFWGSIAAGALFPGMKVISGRQKPHAGDRSRMLLKQIDRKGEMFVDLFVGLAHKATGSFFEGEGYRGEERRQLHMEKPRSLSPAQISRTVAALLDVQRKWDSVGPAIASPSPGQWAQRRRRIGQRLERGRSLRAGAPRRA